LSEDQSIDVLGASHGITDIRENPYPHCVFNLRDRIFVRAVRWIERYLWL